MTTQAYFKDIRLHISAELKNANHSIFVAVAWFTDSTLFNILCSKAKTGLNVQVIVMDDDITRNCTIDYSQLEKCGGKLYQINGDTGNLMHNKFCVIDNHIVITGSYNWSIKAQSNHENITITKESTDLADGFNKEFSRIKILYHGADPLKPFDIEIICMRLSIIGNLIRLKEFQQITLQVDKIKEFRLISDIDSILNDLESKNYSQASDSINSYLIKTKSLTVYEEPDIEQIKWEIKYLEIEIVSLENEKSNIQKIISDFVHTYTLAFGDLLLKILHLKKLKLKQQGNRKADEYEKAQREYQEFSEQFAKEKKDKHEILTPEEQIELKQKYHKAAILCHPDKFQDEMQKEKAQKIFVELQNAYTKNDLKRVTKILENLEKGIYEIDETLRVSAREQLINQLNYLKERYETLNFELSKLRKDKTYRDVISIKNMETFFEEEKNRLETELNNLTNGRH